MKLSRTTGLVNLLYDIPTGTRFTPYIGGGVGFSWRKLRRNFSEYLELRQTPDFPDLPLACALQQSSVADAMSRVSAARVQGAARLRRRRSGRHRLQHQRTRSPGTTAGRCYGKAVQLLHPRRRFRAKIGSSTRTPSCSSSAPAFASSLTESCAPLLSVPKGGRFGRLFRCAHVVLRRAARCPDGRATRESDVAEPKTKNKARSTVLLVRTLRKASRLAARRARQCSRRPLAPFY